MAAHPRRNSLLEEVSAKLDHRIEGWNALDPIPSRYIGQRMSRSCGTRRYTSAKILDDRWTADADHRCAPPNTRAARRAVPAGKLHELTIRPNASEQLLRAVPQSKSLVFFFAPRNTTQQGFWGIDMRLLDGNSGRSCQDLLGGVRWRSFNTTFHAVRSSSKSKGSEPIPKR